MTGKRTAGTDPPLPTGALDLPDRYRVVGKLASGGMGRVVLAEDSELGRRVAIKLIRDELARDPRFVERFWREARAAAAIGHPNIVQVFEVAKTESGLPYIVMEALEGRDLAEELRLLCRLPLRRAVDIAGQVLFALAAAHRAGVVHRDLKPGNVFLARREVASLGELERAGDDGARGVTVKLLDFGVSRLLAPRLAPRQRLTAREDVIGTIKYMAPEQLESSCDVDGRADLYSLGVILFECVAGRSPFGGDDLVLGVMSRAFHRPVPRLHEVAPGVPEAFDEVLARALAESPDDRFADASAFVEALRPFHARPDGEGHVAPGSPRSEGAAEVSVEDEVAARVRRQLEEAERLGDQSPTEDATTEIDSMQVTVPLPPAPRGEAARPATAAAPVADGAFPARLLPPVVEPEEACSEATTIEVDGPSPCPSEEACDDDAETLTRPAAEDESVATPAPDAESAPVLPVAPAPCLSAAPSGAPRTAPGPARREATKGVSAGSARTKLLVVVLAAALAAAAFFGTWSLVRCGRSPEPSAPVRVAPSGLAP